MKRKLLAENLPGTKAPESTWLFRQVVRVLALVFVRLHAWDDRATLRQKKLMLLVFCVVSLILLGFSVYVGGRKPHMAKPMHLPALFLPPQSEHPYMQMTPGRLRQLLDSIGAQPGGRQALDSLRKCRPGLLDTLEKIDVYK